MLKVTPTLFIPDDELTFSFTRGSGPGGQNVNKVATSVQLRFDVLNSPSLTEAVKTRLGKLAGSRITKEGVLIIEAKRCRTQEQNRADAKNRLVVIIRKSVTNQKRRRPTLPSSVSQLRRVEAKKRKGIIKGLRRSVKE